MQAAEIKQIGARLAENIKKVVCGRDDAIHLTLTALFGGGHVLLEDVPGSGKTLLAKALARSIDGSFKRVQFTPDLLPADLSGINFFNHKTAEFEFLRGPVFCNVLLADELNRATPKTQAGLLECMEERQVTADGQTYRLEEPFFVIATQNPIDTQGVFPLPEAQIDRFLVRVPMQYPAHEAAVDILRTHKAPRMLETLTPVTQIRELAEVREAVCAIEVHEDLMDYIVRLVEATRALPSVLLGVSGRGSLALLRLAQARAAWCGRSYVIPDDIKYAAEPVLCHRLLLRRSEQLKRDAAAELIQGLLAQLPVPTELVR